MVWAPALAAPIAAAVPPAPPPTTMTSHDRAKLMLQLLSFRFSALVITKLRMLAVRHSRAFSFRYISDLPPYVRLHGSFQCAKTSNIPRRNYCEQEAITLSST